MCAQSSESSSDSNLEPGVYARMQVSGGEILIRLFYEKTPMTVMNFTGLAEGKFPVSEGKPFYDGLKFHRVISRANGDEQDFMIQGGDPQGNGTGGPGYQFPDEFEPTLRHNKAGILSMANSGPGSNGSQFFITIVPTPHLDDRHTVFGEVIDGLDVVNNTKQDDVIKKLEIIRIGEEAKKFDNSWENFQNYIKNYAEIIKKKKEEELAKEKALLDEKYGDYTATSSGLKYKVIEEGEGSTPSKGDTVTVHYRGTFVNGSEFDSSYSRNQPFEFPVGTGRVIPAWDEAVLDMKIGEKRIIVAPYQLAYGERGYGPIPAKATLIFEIHRLK